MKLPRFLIQLWPLPSKPLGKYLQALGVQAGLIQSAVLSQQIDRGEVHYQSLSDAIMPDQRALSAEVVELAGKAAASALRGAESIRRDLIAREPVTNVSKMPDEIREFLRQREEEAEKNDG